MCATRPRQLEASLQASLVDYHQRAVPEEFAILFAVPNGGKRNKTEAARLKRQGVLAGVSDLILVSLGRVDFIEVKLERSLIQDRETRQSDSQKDFQAKVESLGHHYWIVRSLEDYARLLDDLRIPVRFRPLSPRLGPIPSTRSGARSPARAH